MRCVSGIVFVLFSFFANGEDLTAIRKTFHNAVLDKGKVKEFHDFINKLDDEDATVNAYKAVSKALYAQVEWNPFRKYQLVSDFSEIINQAVNEESDNFEIRFLRLCIEYHLPRFLGFSSNMTGDKAIIMSQLKDIEKLDYDPFFTGFIMYFMDETGLCKPQELTVIKSKLSTKKSKV